MKVCTNLEPSKSSAYWRNISFYFQIIVQNMATLSTVIVPAKALKDGRHKVRIAVAHNGDTRYILTNIVIDKVTEFKNGQVVKRMDASMKNTALRGILQKYQNELDKLDYTEGLTCSELVFLLKSAKRSKMRTLASVHDDYLKTATVTKTSLETYETSWNAIIKVISPDMVIDNLNHSTLLSFKKNLISRGLRSGTILSYFSFLRVLVNYAIANGWVRYEINPFHKLSLTQPMPRQSWLSVEQIKCIRDMNFKHRSATCARDIFMLSYYLGGINLVDLLKVDFNANVNELSYVRQKTQNRHKVNESVTFNLPEEAKSIIEKYKQKNGCILKPSYINRVRYGIMRIAELTGYDNLVYYSARKSFSQHAFDLGVSTSVIDYILGHKLNKGGSSLYSYIEVKPEMATAAIRKVLDNLK